jgi:hypothetical protein
MTLEEIERTVSNLSPAELARFRACFEKFYADRINDAGIASGKLDELPSELHV